jgi:putative membrane protein
MSKKGQKQVDKLSQLSGPKFDKAFIHHAVKDHKKDIQEFKAEAQHGSNPSVRQFASNNVPVLEEHLNIAQNLKKSSMNSAHGSTNGQNGGMQSEGSQ